MGGRRILDLQRIVGNAAVAAALRDNEQSPVGEVLGTGGGRPLEPDVRAEMQARLGHDFSQVRVHDDGRAHESAAAVNAQAYTVGSEIVFQRGGYNPATSAGKLTLAHELTHVIQQSQGPVDGIEAPGGIRVSEPGDRFEREAAANAEKTVAAPAPSARPGPPAPQRVHPGTAQASKARAVVQRDPKQPPVVIPPSPSRQAMIKQLRDEHPDLNPKVADDAVNGAKRVMGAGGAGGDVVLDEHVTREVSVHSGQLSPQNLTTHLQAEAQQAGVREIYLQINSPGATTQSIRQTMNSIQNGIPELAGTRVRVYDSQGRLVWQGNMRFRDTNPIPSRPRGGGGGTGGSGGPPPSGGIGRGRAPAPGPLTGGPVTAGSRPATAGSRPGTSAATSAATRAEMAKIITQSHTSATRSAALTKRIQGYVKAYGALTHLLSLLSAIDNMRSMLAHGTALPKEQKQADQVLTDSTQAKDEADQVTENLDLVQWTILAGEAERADDDKTLFAIDEAASTLRDSLEKSAAEAQEHAENLEATAAPMMGEMYKQLLAAITPNANDSGTADNAIAASLFASLQVLHGTIQAASQNYAETAETLKWWAQQVREIGHWANDSAWAILRGRAWEQYLAAHPEAGQPKP